VINVGVIGYGYWGPNLVRNFAECPDSQVVGVSDLSEQRLAMSQRRYPGIQVTQNYQDLLNNPQIDAIAIATPVSTHYPIALAALQAGKHVLVEKPLTATSQQALHLVEEAAKRERVLLVDHIFIYSSAIRKVRELVTQGQLGEILYYDAVRVNLGLFQHDVNVLWDLAVHDLSIMMHVLPELPCAVAATGISHVPNQPENIAYLTLFFNSNLIAHIHVNWLAPVKIRRSLIVGSQKMIVYDDLEPSEKLRVYDRGITVAENPDRIYQMLVDYRTGDMWSPQLDMAEALQTEVRHFVNCIETQKQPFTPGESGLQVIQILEAATESLRHQGRLVHLNLT
jgi:predicted dehydrogenase